MSMKETSGGQYVIFQYFSFLAGVAAGVAAGAAGAMAMKETSGGRVVGSMGMELDDEDVSKDLLYYEIFSFSITFFKMQCRSFLCVLI